MATMILSPYHTSRDGRINWGETDEKENLTDLIYHGFLPLNSQKTSIRLSPQLYTTKDEKIHLDFLPLRPGCKEDPQWEDWNCYHSILSIGWPVASCS